MDQGTDSELLERIPAQDWEATPASVRTLLLSLLPLAAEAAEWRARLQTPDDHATGKDGPYAADDSEPPRVGRYQALLDRLFLHGLSAEEQREMERLGAEMDARNAPLYDAALERMEAASGNGRK